jgi:hypothetical protein
VRVHGAEAGCGGGGHGVDSGAVEVGSPCRFLAAAQHGGDGAVQAGHGAERGESAAVHEARGGEEGEGEDPIGRGSVGVEQREGAAHGVADDVAGRVGKSKLVQQLVDLAQVGVAVIGICGEGEAAADEVVAQDAVASGSQSRSEVIEVEVEAANAMDAEHK